MGFYTLRRAFALAAITLCPAAHGAAEPIWQSKVDAQLLSSVQSKGQSPFIIHLSERADLSAAAKAKSRAEKGRLVYDQLKATATRSQAPVIALLKQRGLSYQTFWISNAIVVKGGLADIQALAQLAAIESLTYITETPTAPAGRFREEPSKAASQASKSAEAKEAYIEPSLTLVHAPEVWALGFKGQGIVVGDHDIGVMWDHPALKRQYRGWDAATQTATHDYNWFNAFGPSDLFCMDTDTPCDSNGHGTHTTGTMVGDDGNGMQVGMAPEAQWMACRSLLDPVAGVGTVPTYMSCMEFMLAPTPTSGDTTLADPTKAPDVVNNSWGCVEGCAPPVLQDVNEATEAAGIIQVVSAGNDGDTCNTILYPLAVYDSSFTVGATDNEDVMAGFSSRGAVVSDLSMRIKPNIVAPGVGTNSAWNDGDYNSISGTSMAGPHVAGLVALVLSAEPKLIGRVRDVRSLIENTAVPIVSGESCSGTSDADIPNNTWGYGRIDALAAIHGLPKLTLAGTAPATAAAGTPFEYTALVRSMDSSKIAMSTVTLTIPLPAGVTLVSSSEDTTSTDGGLVFTHESLEPGASWTVSLMLKSGTAGSVAVPSRVTADQAPDVSGNTTTTSITGSGGSGGGSSGGSGGAAMSPLALLALFGSGLLGLRRRRRLH